MRKAPLTAVLSTAGAVTVAALLGGLPATQSFFKKALEPQILALKQRYDEVHAQNLVICEKLGIKDECEQAVQVVKDTYRKVKDGS